MTIIDTHTHLETFARRGELPAVLARAKEAGLSSMIAIGTRPDDWSLYRDLAHEYRSYVHYTVGLHPCSVDEEWENAIAQIESFFDGATKPVALGEIGLDRFHLPKDNGILAEQIFGWQRAAFAEGLAIVRRRSCPVVIHSRGAFNECVEMIDTSGVDWSRVVFHCFTEGPTEMAELTRRGAYGSFTGIITYKNAEPIRAAAKVQGLERLMIETDAPYLTPVPHRGKPNEPAYLRHTADYCAELFGVNQETLAKITTRNARTFFGI
ncbi:MAG TPA: TatD family hydrolase [Opitutaceae bacterium]|nr:TatD family hydrolase [Opitutaceae bacterium]